MDVFHQLRYRHLINSALPRDLMVIFAASRSAILMTDGTSLSYPIGRVNRNKRGSRVKMTLRETVQAKP